MLKEKLASIKINPESFDKQKSTLILTTVLSGIGLGAMAALEALGMVKEAEATEESSDS